MLGREELSIELSAFESNRLWPLLDEAEDIGVRLVYPRALGPVQRFLVAGAEALEIVVTGTVAGVGARAVFVAGTTGTESVR